MAVIIWERGQGFEDGAERQALFAMVADLTRRGYRHLRPPGNDIDGPLLPYRVEDRYVGNVFSLASNLEFGF